MTQIQKAIIPVAGLGTRFLPASKSIPKEMVTIVDRPAIAYVVQEAIEAGIKQIILVTHASKSAIEDYFDSNFELETTLVEKKKFDLLAKIKQIVPSDVDIISIRQPQALGLGHAVLCAKSVIGDDDFVVLLPDVLIKNTSEQHDLSYMIQRYQQTQSAQIMVEMVEPTRVDQYGIVDVVDIPQLGESQMIKAIVEKPKIDEAPSHLAVVGRYVLPAKIMTLLEQTPIGLGQEIQLTDAIAQLQTFEKIEAYHMQGQSFDCGHHLGYLKAILHYGIDHHQLGNDFKQLIRELTL